MIRKSSLRRFLETEDHVYCFLICDGNGAASRGGEVDNYSEKTIRAVSFRDAMKQIWEFLIGNDGDDDFEEWLENRGLRLNATGKDIFKAIDRDLEVDAGDPWIEGVARDGKVVIEPKYLQERVWEEEYFDRKYFKEHRINPKFWHIDLPDDEDF